VGCHRVTDGWGVSSQAPEGNRREWHRRGGFAETPGRAHSSGLYMEVGYLLWGTECQRTGTARHALAFLTELQEPRRVEGAVTATGVAGHKRGHSGRNALTGESLGAIRWRVGGLDKAEGVGRRNLSCTGKPRGLREISGRTREGDQANRLPKRLPSGYLRCPVVSWRDIVIFTRAESLDRHP
jgi:hypothetical protein